VKDPLQALLDREDAEPLPEADDDTEPPEAEDDAAQPRGLRHPQQVAHIRRHRRPNPRRRRACRKTK